LDTKRTMSRFNGSNTFFETIGGRLYPTKTFVEFAQLFTLFVSMRRAPRCQGKPQ
jgi:hypothetical protein